MSERNQLVRLLHMRDYARRATAIAADYGRSDLEQNEMLYLALTRLLELIGEAASQVPRHIRANHPDIPWSLIVGMRNHLIHGYDFIDPDIIWDTIANNLPRLIQQLDHIIETSP